MCFTAINAKEHRNRCKCVFVSSYQIESDWNGIEWNMFALLYFNSIAAQMVKIPVSRPHSPCPIHLFTSLSRLHSSFILSPYHSKKKRAATSTNGKKNTNSNVHRTSVTVSLTSERERECAARAISCKFIAFNLPFLRRSFCFAFFLALGLAANTSS